MIKEPISFLHTGDIQIEVRNHQQRYDEFNFILRGIEHQINNRKPTVYLIAGDVFEFCRPNDMERLLFINHLKSVAELDFVKEIVITYGNHDIDQRKSTNFFKRKGEDQPAENSLDSIVEAVGESKIQLLKSSTLYQSKVDEDLLYLNWSQKTKHSDIIQEQYNPVNNIVKVPDDKTVITIYHDPIQGCKQWDGNELRGSNKSAMDEFVTPTILAGDIHMPQIITAPGKQLIYCGSPVARNFGEGDYYKDGRLVQSGAYMHTVNCGLIQPDGTVTNQEFVKIKQYRTYATYEVTTKTVPDDWSTMNWEVAHPGLYETLIKVKMPSATETFLKAEPDIIDAIKKQNQNIITDIVFFYGKAINDEEEQQVLQINELEKLITEEKITDVATEYINKQVQKSATIVAEDKEKVIKVVTDLFVREMKNFCNDIVSNRITFQKIRIDNFMSFGSGVIVDMNSFDGLIKLTGGNGVGKTTFYNSIKWVLTGFISRDQNKVKKNENNLLIFNDYRWSSDEVFVALKMLVNNNVVVVLRKATREWKKNTTDEQKQSKEWKKYISGTTQSVTVQIVDETIQGDKAEEWLTSIFGGLENLERIVFPNQYTLKSFVCSDPARLCEEVLNHVGMNFFERMEAAYETVRKNELSSLAKPSQTIDALKQLIVECELHTKEIDEKLDDIGNDIGSVDMNLLSTEGIIKGLNSKKHPGITKETIDTEQTNIDTEQTSISERLKKANAGEEMIVAKINQTNIDELTANVESAQKAWETAQSNLGESRVAAEKINADIQSNVQNVRIRTTEIESEYKEKKSNIRMKIVELESSKKALTSDIQMSEIKRKEILNNDIAQKDKYISDCTHDEQIHTSVLNSNMGELNELSKHIESLKNSTVCPTCHRELDAEHIVHIQEQVKQLTDKYKDIETKNQELKKDIELIQQSRRTMEISKKQLIDNPETYTVWYEEKLRGDKLVKQKEDIESQIFNLEASFNDIDNVYKQALKEDFKIIELLSIYETLKQKLSESASKASDLAKELELKKQEFDSAQSVLADYNKNIQNLERIRSMKTAIDADQKALDIRKETLALNIEKLKENQELDERITKEQNYANDLKKSLNELQEQEKELRVQKQSFDISKRRYEMDIENAVLYRVTEQGLKQYKTLLGKQGLPQHIFSMIRGLLNHRLNDLLEYMEFRLHFNQDNQLQMIDLSKPSNPIRTPMQMSGMQTVFTGLALIYVNRLCNNTFIFDGLYIDEVSGQLNTGEELTYESQNYQEQLKRLLKQFTNLKVWIVDHVIEDMEENFRLEVVPSNDGAHIITR